MAVYTQNEDGTLTKVEGAATMGDRVAQARQAKVDAGEEPSPCVKDLLKSSVKVEATNEQESD